MLQPNDSPTSDALLLTAVIGFLVGLGKLLASKEVLTFRLVIGRALVHTGLAVAAGGCLLLLVPDAQFLAVIGAAAASASIGESLLEKLSQKYLK